MRDNVKAEEEKDQAEDGDELRREENLQAQEENRNVRREQPKAEKKEEPEIDLDNNLNIDELMGNARPGGPSL